MASDMECRTVVPPVVTRTEPLSPLTRSTFENDSYVYDALRAGAAGFLLKRAAAEDLVAAVRLVAAPQGQIQTGDAVRGGIAQDAPRVCGHDTSWPALQEAQPTSRSSRFTCRLTADCATQSSSRATALRLPALHTATKTRRSSRATTPKL
jgi:DNA-binding NarL/FixJ family response regulator